MPRVRLEPTGTIGDVPEGTRLIDFCDENPGAGLPTACRDANCGICMVFVDPPSAAAPPDTKEVTTLRALKAPSGARLGCQVVISATSREIVVRTRR